jgi:hypothetical protein
MGQKLKTFAFLSSIVILGILLYFYVKMWDRKYGFDPDGKVIVLTDDNEFSSQVLKGASYRAQHRPPAALTQRRIYLA